MSEDPIVFTAKNLDEMRLWEKVSPGGSIKASDHIRIMESTIDTCGKVTADLMRQKWKEGCVAGVWGTLASVILTQALYFIFWGAP